MDVVGSSIQRIDGIAKASGNFKYAGDVRVEHALAAKVLFSAYAHALIKSIDTTSALNQPGVRAVLTAKDIQGTNTFGPIIADQPVLCDKKVRYIGDAIALVAADNEEQAERALDEIRIEYEPLQVITTTEEGLQPDAPLIHEKGNVVFRDEYSTGDVVPAFRKADLVISEKYHTPRQKHMYIEPEAGFAFPKKNGVEVHVSTQSPYHDRMQISRALGMREDAVRVIAIDPGGAFGGKEESSIPIHLALLAMKTRKPVKMTWTREESGASAPTRNAMDIELKTGFRKDGVILANEARIIAYSGAYISYGSSVLEVATGSANGPYRIPNTHVEGLCVYTNNPPAGAMRGFGMAQINFAMECQLDVAAEKLGIDPIQLRRINAALEGDPDGTGTAPITKPRLLETLAAAEKVDLWKKRAALRGQGERPWLWKGVGFAAGMKSVGYGAFPERVKVTIRLDKNGYTVFVSNPEMGSGTSIALTQIAAQALGTSMDKVILSPRDTDDEIDSGASNASRVVYVVGNAIVQAAEKLRRRVLELATKQLRVKPLLMKLTANAVVAPHGKKIALAKLVKEKAISASAWYSPPRPPNALLGTAGIPNVLFSYAASVAHVEVNQLTGQVRVLGVVFLPEVGTVINPLGLEAQCEGGVTQSVGYALLEDLLVEQGKVRTPNFTTYLVPTLADVPRPIIMPVNAHEPTGPFGAKGAGELPTIAVPAAICNAIHDATGARVKTIPAIPERVLAAIAEVNMDTAA
jgi:CO/xanthine dehydrogenase Mo-binding subunit